MGSHRECKWKMSELRLSRLGLYQCQYETFKVFFGFANFYQQFGQGFGKIAVLLTSVLKASATTRSSENSTPSVVKGDEIDGGGATWSINKSSKIQRPKNIGRTEEPSFQNPTISWLQILADRIQKPPFLGRQFRPRLGIRLTTASF